MASYWFGGFHYGVYTKHILYGEKVQLFRTLKAAQSQAKFELHNNDSTQIINLTRSSFEGDVLYTSVCKKRLKKQKTEVVR